MAHSRAKKARAVEGHIQRELNWYRKRNNRSKLKYHPALAAFAKKRSAEQAERGHLTHFDFDGKARVKDCKGFEVPGETCAAHQKGHLNPELVAKKVRSQWVKSADHRACMMKRGARWSGVGVWIDGRKVYATWVFALARAPTRVLKDWYYELRRLLEE